jgi:DNA-directed RNA polymerase beta subunit
MGCLEDASPEERRAAAQSLDKEAQIGAKVSDRKWTQLWFRGKLRVSEQNSKHWVLLDVHKGLCASAFDSLKGEGVECESRFDSPHISVLRPEECEELKKRFGAMDWRGAAKEGKPMRFKLSRLVSLIPSGWKEMDRVWFIECESPDLVKYRRDLGFDDLPVQPKKGHEMRFHITFAVKRSTARKAAELLMGVRAQRGLDGGLWVKEASSNKEGEQLLGVFSKMELDPDVTSTTLGERHEKVSTNTLLRASSKLLNISKGTEDVDDRDSLAFQTLHSPEDFFGERVRKDAGQLRRKLLWRSTLRGSVQHIPSGALSPQMMGVLLRSGMGMPLEETNPIEIFDQQLRVIRLGEGGIPSLDSIPDESRNIQPSHFGYVDPIRSPESEKVGVDSRVSHKALRGSDGKFYTRMLNREGKETHVSAEAAARGVVAFPGEFEKPDKLVRAMVRSRQIEYVPREEVDYILPHPAQMFTATSNLVPMISGIKGGRLLMGAKFYTQALPLRDAEAPLVQAVGEGERSFDELYGDKVGAVYAKTDGVVIDMNKQGVAVRYADGTKETHELYDNFPFNRKTFVHNTPVVKIGDRVGAGQLLARSN